MPQAPCWLDVDDIGPGRGAFDYSYFVNKWGLDYSTNITSDYTIDDVTLFEPGRRLTPTSLSTCKRMENGKNPGDIRFFSYALLQDEDGNVLDEAETYRAKCGATTKTRPPLKYVSNAV